LLKIHAQKYLSNLDLCNNEMSVTVLTILHSHTQSIVIYSAPATKLGHVWYQKAQTNGASFAKCKQMEANLSN